MKRSLIGRFGASFAMLLTASAISAAEPAPALDFDFSKAGNGIVKDSGPSGLSLDLGKYTSVKDNALQTTPSANSFAAADEAAFKAWAKKQDVSELSAAFWIRFDKRALFGGTNSKTASLGLFDCFVDKDGKLAVKIFTKKTELMKPVVMKSKFDVEYGKWYHVEFSYSMNCRTYKLYVDGDFQMENDTLMMPEPAIGMLKLGNGFYGAVKDLKFYTMALSSEELALSKFTATDYALLAGKAAEIAKNTQNTYLRGYANELAKRANTYQKNVGKVTIAAQKRLANAIDNLQKIADGLAAAPKATVSDKIVTSYVTPATTQALYLPDNLPENGSLSNKIEIVMAKDEFETSSIVVVPFSKIQNFTFRMGDLRNGNSVIKGSDVDIMLVKRQYRTGGAWLAYHVDLYMRTLTPDMMLHDDKLFTYDEFRRSNYVFMRYPGNEHYVDVSKFAYDREWLDKGLERYLYDAPTFQPMTLPEAGRTQQFVVTFHVSKDMAPGFYDGDLQMLADGKDAGTIHVTIRVLPFVLPQPRTYYDSSKTYISHCNSYDGVPARLKNALDHNIMHLSDIASSPDRLKECVKIGYPLEIIFDSPRVNDIFVFGGPDEKITPEFTAQMERMAVAPFLRRQKMIEKYNPSKNYFCYRCQSSESSWYGTISQGPDQFARALAEKTKYRLFSHGMSDALPFFSPGIYDMNSSSGIERRHADIWHSMGGRAISYATPFPGPENPGLMRRAMGLELYKANLYDGHMMHGYTGSQMNEFTKYPGGDGDYRNFCLAYNQKDGCINRIAIVGVREGYDDIRYATMMKLQAENAIKTSKDELVVREAKRQLAWLERVDGNKMDMDDFRTDVQFRIMTLMNLIKEREGK